MMTVLASVKCMQSRDDDCKHYGKECLLGRQKFGKADSLWLWTKKGKGESSSGSGEERGRAKVCSAPVRRGVKEGGVREEDNSTLCCRDERYVAGWRGAEEKEKK